MNTDRALIHALRERGNAKKKALSNRIHKHRVAGEDAEQLIGRYVAIHDINDLLAKNIMIDILNNDLFEIYVCNPKDIHNSDYAGNKAGDITGWDIKWVLAPNREAIKKYPFFDCIITQNDNSAGQAHTAELFIP